ncbi:MAG: hypothetical protein A4E40_00289 [Methanoregulaceae archaeon PtaU1.Bin059]|nr:MAG: hypothetical protein A4E39_00918 [Methanoregulaceae archaeon PtaB.Bin152]OPY42816.1 MAG: hypothetical protein A4E40_00289 [Methanoregulaceae archaeon PtaU1.Bin059]
MSPALSVREEIAGARLLPDEALSRVRSSLPGSTAFWGGCSLPWNGCTARNRNGILQGSGHVGMNTWGGDAIGEVNPPHPRAELENAHEREGGALPAVTPKVSPAHSHFLALAMLLAGSAGFMDAMTMIALPQVFSSMMSGNLLFLILDFVAPALFWKPGLHAVAVLAYIAGIGFSMLLSRAFAGRCLPGRTTFLALIVIEVLLLVLFSVCGFWYPPFPGTGVIPLAYLLVSLASAAMGIQNSLVPHVAGVPVQTGFMTGTLGSLVKKGIAISLPVRGAASCGETGDRDQARREFWVLAPIFSAFFAGAVIGGVIAVTVGPEGTLVVPAALTVAIAYWHVRGFPER